MRTTLFSAAGLLMAGLFLTAPVASAQTTTKVKGNAKETTIKQKNEAGGKTKIKAEEGKPTKVKSNMGGDAAVMPAVTTPGGGVMVGGAMMLPSRDIVDNAVLSNDHTTLVAAVKAAGLVETLKGSGPYTVFAPTNAAFGKLPAGTVDNLLLPENKAKLTTVLTYHVVPGKITAADLRDGQVLTTVQGQTLTVMKTGNSVMLKDGKGMMATVTTPDVISSNGVTHVIDTVLMPAM